VTAGQVKIISGPRQIRWHGGGKIFAMLPAIGGVEFYACDLSDGVPLVGRLERPGEKRLFDDRLWRKLRINTRRSEKDELLETAHVSCVDDAAGDRRVIVKKISRERGIGQNAANLGHSHKDCVRAIALHPGFDIGRAPKIKLIATNRENVGARLLGRPAHDGRADHAAVARYKDALASKRV